MKVAIVGASGFGGVELLRVLLKHDKVEVCGLSSVSFTGEKISSLYPNLRNICDFVLLEEDEAIKEAQIVFAALPHGLSESLANKCLQSGKKLIDLGADFRLNEEATYQKWYKKPFSEPSLHRFAAYCIPELHASRLKEARIVANPGCYPTASALAIAPLIKQVAPNSIIIDAKSGVTGAGRGLSGRTHFPAANEAFEAYSVASHRHTPEIEQTLSELAGEEVRVTFTPHLLPLNRGILATIYASLSPNSPLANLEKEEFLKTANAIYREFYKNARFVRVLEVGESVNVRDVKGSNFCDIALHFDDRTRRVVITSVIDNMCKGAATQAVQNMNLMCGFDEADGIELLPTAF